MYDYILLFIITIYICLLFQKYYYHKNLAKLYNEVNIWKTKNLEELKKLTYELNVLKTTYESDYDAIHPQYYEDNEDESFDNSDSDSEIDKQLNK